MQRLALEHSTMSTDLDRLRALETALVPPKNRRLIRELIKQHDKTERPNKHTDRVAWNSHFEFEILLKYTSYAYIFPAIEQVPEVDWSWQCSDITELNQKIAREIKEIMRDEGKLVAIAVENLLGTFGSDWNALDGEKKEEIALDGLYRGACAATRDNSRVICPEMTIKGLIGDGEYSLINMLRRIIAHDPTGNGRVKELYLFEHPYVQHEYRCSDDAPDLLKAFLYRAILLRNSYIVETLLGVLQSYLDRPPAPNWPAKVYCSLRNEERAEAKKISRAECKKADLARKVDGSQCREQAAIAVYGCYSCSVKLKSRTDLKRCGRCNLAWCCSPECQKKDWKDHKRFCGKTSFDPKFLAPIPDGPDEFIGCPAAVPGFIRTPALWRQIWYLSKPDSQRQDYHFDTGYEKTRSVRIVYPPGAQMVFLVARRRAMASGDASAIYMILRIVEYQKPFVPLDLTSEQFRGQFEREYRVTISEAGRQAAGPFAPPTDKELEEERGFLEQRLALVPTGVAEE
ncbi:hypothetical protein FB451DRAFT_1273482 [Mycena latifolia]|nr:hypothetical protein FB451DRAFT_1273482 [Mycena latifolia]